VACLLAVAGFPAVACFVAATATNFLVLAGFANTGVNFSSCQQQKRKFRQTKSIRGIVDTGEYFFAVSLTIAKKWSG